MKTSVMLLVLVSGVLLASMHAAQVVIPLSLIFRQSSPPIQVNLGNHVMHATLPGDRALRMAIESRSGL